MKLALHRSLSFWSGLFVMGFICWAWHDSFQMGSHAILGRLGFSHCNGGVSFGLQSDWRRIKLDRESRGVYPDWAAFPPPHLLLRAANSEEDSAEVLERLNYPDNV